MPTHFSLWTRFESKSYKYCPRGGLGHLSRKMAEPIDEASNSVRNRRTRPETDRAFEVSDVRIGFRNVSRLHRQEFLDCGLADHLFDQAHDFDDLDRLAIADVIEVPWSSAGCGIGRVSRPCRICRWRARDQTN